ncbi:MAG: GNAT family N-acetyltransferase, partial [Clostridia bacterium]|nr:GNAT family N-acetyltransferase [Clostridia bacterium]
MIFDNNDKRIRHFELMLTRSLDNLPVHPLPVGYRFVPFQPGDREAWIEIEQSAKEFDSFDEGAAAWARYYGDREEELPDRMIFIETASGEKVATATAMYDVFGRDKSGSAWLHWVSVRRDHQGRGLSKPLVCEAFRIMKGFGYTCVVVPTQTNTWLAVK